MVTWTELKKELKAIGLFSGIIFADTFFEGCSLGMLIPKPLLLPCSEYL